MAIFEKRLYLLKVLRGDDDDDNNMDSPPVKARFVVEINNAAAAAPKSKVAEIFYNLSYFSKF